ncbi:hypothetical protein DRO33_05510, partial [Candidatus Bathyarchaeota archaeon]
MGSRARVLVAIALILVLMVLAAGTSTALAQEEGGEEEQEEVTEYVLYVKVLDYDGEPLKGALVEALNATGEEREVLNSTYTNSTGWATLWVPNGSTCDIEVVWKEALVGSLENVTVETNMTLGPINCSVCDLAVRVVMEDGRPVMRARVEFFGNYTKRDGNYTTFRESLTTNSSGVCVLEGTLMACNYTIKAFRHGLPEPFDELRLWRLNETTVVNLTCPLLTIRVSVVDEQMRPVVGAEVEAVDWGTGEVISSAPVDERGLALVKVAFGRCVLRA